MEQSLDYASWSSLPPAAKQLFLQAVEHWNEPGRSEEIVAHALELFPNDREVFISGYRFYFYRSQPERALSLARRVLEMIAQELSLPSTWTDIQPRLAAGKDDPQIRLYLAAYAGEGLLLAQLGRHEDARLIAGRIKELDERREFCGSAVFDVLNATEDQN